MSTVIFKDTLDPAAVGAGGDAERPPALRRAPRPVQKRDSSKRLHKKLSRLSSQPIIAVIGPNGSGKSLLGVLLSLATVDGLTWECYEPSHLHCDTIWQTDPITGQRVLDKHGEPIWEAWGPNAVFRGQRQILSTVAILNSVTGELADTYHRLRDWPQVLNAEHCFIYFDEVTGIAGSREAMGMPVDVQNVLNQLRRKDCLLVWTAPAWNRADTIIRSCTTMVVTCRGYFSDRSVLKSDTPPAWLPKRLFKWRVFPREDFDEWSASKASQDDKGKAVKPLRAKIVIWYWGIGSRAFSSYDTLGAVTRVGVVLDSGRCSSCGGRKTAPPCRCDH